MSQGKLVSVVGGALRCPAAPHGAMPRPTNRRSAASRPPQLGVKAMSMADTAMPTVSPEPATTPIKISATLAANEALAVRRRAGETVLPLAFGEAGLPAHPMLRAALAAASDGNSYGPVAGLTSLREAAAGYWTRRGLPTSASSVVCGPGSKPLLFGLLLAIGADVAVPRPSWVSYAAQASMIGVRTHFVPAPPGQGGICDPAGLADLKGTPAYTFENDPSVKLTRALANAAQLNAGYESALSQAQAALAHAQAEASAVNGTSGASPAQGPRDANGETARLAGVVNQTSVSAGADLEMTGERGSSLGYDAMEVTFEVSSERRLNSPYVVTITRFHEKGSEPGMLRQLVYAKALDPIGNHPSAVRFLEGGFPLAFELKNFEVHLYNLGAEVATNVAPQREQLTRDEAFNY